MDREQPNWNRFTSTELIDYFDNPINVNDRLLRPTKSGQLAIFEMCKVTKIHEGKMYLDNSKVAIQYPGRCVNISYLRNMAS